MTACQQYREDHGPADGWAPGEMDGYLEAVDADRVNGAEEQRKEGGR